MRALSALLAAALFSLGHGKPVGTRQQILLVPSSESIAPKALHGRFLHITDLHPDPYYKIHSSTEEGLACHRGLGPSGTYGAETSDCDSPFVLINATFKWIKENLRDSVDFVVWTGDSARHDNDEEQPRDKDQILSTNRYIADKFAEVFGNGLPGSGSTADMDIPVVPTFGNNDILPHNILQAGPNEWLRSYTDIWRRFIPEEQRHGFERGGWFYVEVIPKKLAVFSLNTLYFFDHNSAVDGCNAKTEPGFEHFEWLRIQLGFIRQRGMKAILTGHVPPSRTDSKQLWDETCWQKYTLWLQQYRDVVVGGIYGHMNIDHFLIQDTKSIDVQAMAGLDLSPREHLDDELTVNSAADYLEELRDGWSKLPNPSAIMKTVDLESDKKKQPKKEKKPGKSKNDKLLKEMGGPWGERFQLTLVSPSLVPNYFPTIRVVEYNITGLQKATRTYKDTEDQTDNVIFISPTKKTDKKPQVPKDPKDPNLVIPAPPSKSSPPGPAYSPQSLTLLGYTQYFANITYINNDVLLSNDTDDVDTTGWHGGKHKHKKPGEKVPHPKEFKFEVEYNTLNDSRGFKLKDMTVRSYMALAHRIALYEPSSGSETTDESAEDDDSNAAVAVVRMFSEVISDMRQRLGVLMDRALAISAPWAGDSAVIERDNLSATGKKNKKDKKKKKKKKKKKDKDKNKAWLTFIKRAFVGTMDDDQVVVFQAAREMGAERFQEEEL